MNRLVSHLLHGKRTDAVRLFLDAQDHDLAPDKPALARWLVKNIGKEATLKLIEAFAVQPCFFCKKGRESCGSCEGAGVARGGMVCASCAGLGVTRCDFCDGTGWAAIDTVPDGLKPAVVIERTTIAAESLKKTLQRRIPRPTSQAPAALHKKAVQRLLLLDRHLGVFENTVVAARQLTDEGHRPNSRLAKAVRTCLEPAVSAGHAVRQTLELMATCARMEATNRSAERSAKTAAATNARYYQSLAASGTLAEAGLDHPFLREAIKRSQSGAKKPRKNVR